MSDDRFYMQGQVLIKKVPPTIYKFNEHRVVKIYDAVTVALSSTGDSSTFDIGMMEGFFSIQWVITGDGTAKIEVYTSNNGTTFLDTMADIASAQTKTTGPASDGNNMASFQVMLCQNIFIRVTETGGANSITISAWMKGK